MYVAWTHTPCGTRNEQPTVGECSGCGRRPRATFDVVQHSAAAPGGAGERRGLALVATTGDRAAELPVPPWEARPVDLVPPPVRRT